MAFIQRMKDKDYRIKVVLIAVIILVIIGNTGETKKEAAVLQSQCNLANTESGGPCDFSSPIQNIIGDDTCMDKEFFQIWKPKSEDYVTCVTSSCFVGRNREGEALDTFGCFSLVPNGLYAESEDNCEGEGMPTTNDDGYPILCKASPPGVDPSTRDCNAAMTGIADVIQDIAPELNLGCRSAFYIVIFGGALIVMMIFAAL